MKRLVVCLILILGVMLLAPFTRAHAQEEGEGEGKPGGLIINPNNAKPPPEHHDGITTNVWTFKPEVEGDTARGTARVVCYSDDKDSFRMDLQGLKPKGVYTVWFLSSSKAGAERAGIGNEPFSFKPTGGGSTLYQAPLKTCPLAKFKWVEVRLHPDGNPTNYEGGVRVMKARMIAE